MNSMDRYTIKSVSNDGIWYLIKGWREYRTYWQEFDQCVPESLFKRKADAKRSLTKLLKYMMAEYGNDDFTLVMLEWDSEHWCYTEREIEKITIDNQNQI